MRHNFFILVFILLYNGNGYTQVKTPAVHFNQVGFYPAVPKIAVVTGMPEKAPFYVLEAGTGDTVYRGQLSDTMQSAYSSAFTRLADFSPVKKHGRYALFVPGVGQSYAFRIAPGVHHQTGIDALKMFYYMRVSMALEAKYAGKWARPAGHPDTAVLIHPSAATPQRPAGTVVASPGGWYDAGDYNKYIVNSGITMGTLLSAYEDFAAYYDKLRIGIPESEDRLPDLLNEILVNLRWMLTMQDPHDGGVYHKCTNADFDGMVMPGVTTLPRYMVQKSTPAALDFAAVMAQAGRVFRQFEKQLPGLADSCIHAAIAAWQWAQKNPATPYNQNAINQQFEPKITTGAYGDWTFTDEWFWAASELTATTGADQYVDTIVSRWQDRIGVPTWNSVHLMGYYTLLRHQSALQKKSRIDFAAVRTRLLQFADGLIANGGDRAYATIMGQSRNDFVWGSSSVAMNQSIVLINAWLLTRQPKYAYAALSNLDYVLGRNATGYSFITGVGSKTPMHPHHRPSVADGIPEPVPGMLVGGPNPGQQDRCEGYPSRMPAESFLDHDCSYASNEIAINWNAPLVYVVNALEAILGNE